ncbi:MAG: 2-oxo acid dehydrogenase subunit E2 [Porticoccaceae bacterium]|jgi:pyruvate dehydrogenase E2 component (dihydrolipoamide acetyltransferase)|nr:2-oxo acid dehydrogenase subunit E2 [Porticoccaceae bacterium]
MRYFKLPDLGEGLQEAEIIEWHVKPGDQVMCDQLLLSVETAKAIVDVPSPCDGVIANLFGKPGDILHIGEPLVEFEGGEDDSGTVVGEIKSRDDRGGEETFIIGGTASSGHGDIHATPAIRALAKRLQVNLQDVIASGRHGMITHDDVERAARLRESHGEAELLRGVRRTMAIAMAKAHAEVVKVTIEDDVDLHAWGKNFDVTMRLVRAIGVACGKEPGLNCWFDGATLRRRLLKQVDLGIAVDTPDGLFVPVLRNINERTAEDLRAGLDALRVAVEKRKIPPAELQGATIALSNYGMMAGRYADPVVVPPMVCIVGAGQIRDRVVAFKGQPAVHPVLPLSLSFDHRVITGGEAARFLAALMADLVSVD